MSSYRPGRQGPFISLPAGSAAVSNGAVLDGDQVFQASSLQVTCSAAPTAGTIALEGSLDGENWSELVSISPTTAGPQPIETSTSPVRYLRAAITVAITGATIEAVIAFAGAGTGGPQVSSVFGRTGAVVGAAGDYTAAEITNIIDEVDPTINTALGTGALSSNNGVASLNVAVGANALHALDAVNTSDGECTAVGAYALSSFTGGVADGDYANTAVGKYALGALTTGGRNTAIGAGTMEGATQGSSNTAVGTDALYNTTGSSNVAVGASALEAATTASSQTAVGTLALASLTTGAYNTAVGFQALQAATTSSYNTAVGFNALNAATSNNNTAVGAQALQALTTGNGNTAVGLNALLSLTTSSANTAVGVGALQTTTGANNTALGWHALIDQTTGHDNVALGVSAGASATTAALAVLIGSGAGYTPAGVAANATIAGNNVTCVGYNTGAGAATDPGNITCLGSQTTCTSPGGVAIGIDHTGTAAASTAEDMIALGTANHQVKIANNATGAGNAALGANCPAVTPAAPYTWLKLYSGDGSTVYVPAWK